MILISPVAYMYVGVNVKSCRRNQHCFYRKFLFNFLLLRRTYPKKTFSENGVGCVYNSFSVALRTYRLQAILVSLNHFVNYFTSCLCARNTVSYPIFHIGFI